MFPHGPLFAPQVIWGEFSAPVSVLAVGAHPDDVDWSVSGLLLQEHDRGNRTAVIDLTLGEAGTRGTPELRRIEALAASEKMGLACRVQYDMGDGRLEATLEASLTLAHAIRVLRPTLVVACFPEDKHPDHGVTGKIAQTAMFHSKMKLIDLGAPIWSPRALLYYNQHIYRHPDFVIDISEVYERKVEAAACFASQFGTPLTAIGGDYIPVGITDYMRIIETRAKQYGSLIGVPFGEGYQAASTVRIDDPVRVLSGLRS